MEERKLTKADIDKVRHIEGFPIAKDEDIIALSRPPYYTACPNPFIEEFIRENGTPYDEATDDYHREPFAADVSEGKSDPIYNAHSYHTKVPHKAIMRFILHYTKPGDLVFDGFCGTGMTGVAAQMCGCADDALRAQIASEIPEVKWGTRKAILNDLSPIATFISYNYNADIDADRLQEEGSRILHECQQRYAWMYETYHVDENGNPVIGLTGTPLYGRINYTVWSDTLTCPSCTKEIVFYNVAVNPKTGAVAEKFTCPHCGSVLGKKDCKKIVESYYDKDLQQMQERVKQVPVLISYTYAGRKYTKSLDSHDFDVLKKIDETDVVGFIPTTPWCAGEKPQEPIRLGIKYVHQMYYRRTLVILSALFDEIKKSEFRSALTIMFTSQLVNLSKMNRYRPAVSFPYNPLSGTLYIAAMTNESNCFVAYDNKVKKLSQVFSRPFSNDAIVSCSSLTSWGDMPENCIDYIFTDPPFGANLNYSELSFIWEAWLGVITNSNQEAIINSVQKKALAEYQQLMEDCFRAYHRVLKPGHWMSVEFHNSKNAVWNAIQEALQRSGFIVADVRVINKQQGSFNQVTAAGAVQQDLVISAYKPRDSFVREFQQRAGDPEMAWEFVRQHLRNVPVTADGNHDGKLDIISERQDYLLFDRMVAWHIMNGIPVPMDAHTFYEGLRQRFLERDGMFFLPDQVNEYDDKRAHMELDTAQLSFIVTDEKNAIQWLNYILAQGPMTYQEIQPLYMQELHQSRQEKMPELLDMLKENFVQDDKGAWYVPDLTNAADLAKVRRKALLKEFWDSCATGRGKLKVFRMEAIRAGFDECWKTRDFKTIVAVGERLPEAVLQEDPALLMYYDNACSRV